MKAKKTNQKIDKTEIVQSTAEHLLELLMVEAKVNVQEDTEYQVIKVKIETPDQGILIGFHGETLSAFQLLLSIITGKKLGEWIRVLVNVGDYREKREEVLRHMGLNAAQKVRFSGEPVSLSDLSAADRRVVHVVLSEYDDITTESEGEGKDRKLIIKPKKSTG